MFRALKLSNQYVRNSTTCPVMFVPRTAVLKMAQGMQAYLLYLCIVILDKMGHILGNRELFLCIQLVTEDGLFFDFRRLTMTPNFLET